MDGIVQILGLVGLVVAIPAAVGAALALIRASYTKAQVEALDNDNDRLRKRAKDLEEEVEHLKIEGAAKDERMTALEEKNEVLSEMVTQRADLEQHHRVVMSNYQTIVDRIDMVANVVKEVLSYVRRGHPHS